MHSSNWVCASVFCAFWCVKQNFVMQRGGGGGSGGGGAAAPHLAASLPECQASVPVLLHLIKNNFF